MSLVSVEVRQSTAPMPESVRAFLDEADARIERFLDESADDPIIGFVPSDFASVYAALRTIADDGLAPGRRLCEWGCGFGVVASMAAMLNFQSFGIEVEGRLLKEARALARDFGLDVEFGHGNFVPRGGEEIADHVEEHAYLSQGGPCGHEDMAMLPDEFDVVYAFPWPGEESVMLDLFEEFAAEGALLVTYHGREGVYAWRQTGSARR